MNSELVLFAGYSIIRQNASRYRNNYRKLFVKDIKKVSFSQEASKNLKGIPCYPSKICKSLSEYLILSFILRGCLSLFSSRLYSRTRQYPIKKHLILSVCLYYPKHLKFLGKEKHLRTPFLQNSSQ